MSKPIKTAASAEESASAAQELTAQSRTLKDVVDQLNALVGGAESMTYHGASGRAATARHTIVPTPPLQSAHKANLAGAEVQVADGGNGKDSFPMDEDFKEF